MFSNTLLCLEKLPQYLAPVSLSLQVPITNKGPPKIPRSNKSKIYFRTFQWSSNHPKFKFILHHHESGTTPKRHPTKPLLTQMSSNQTTSPTNPGPNKATYSLHLCWLKGNNEAHQQGRSRTSSPTQLLLSIASEIWLRKCRGVIYLRGWSGDSLKCGFLFWKWSSKEVLDPVEKGKTVAFFWLDVSLSAAERE